MGSGHASSTTRPGVLDARHGDGQAAGPDARPAGGLAESRTGCDPPPSPGEACGVGGVLGWGGVEGGACEDPPTHSAGAGRVGERDTIRESRS